MAEAAKLEVKMTHNHKVAIWVALAVGGVLTVWFAWLTWWAPAVVRAYSQDPSMLAKLGQAGDLFGGVNALFAALAFAGVAVAAYFQFRTNDLQNASHLLLETQQTRQAFEPLFFHLLALKHERYGSLDIEPPALLRNKYNGYFEHAPYHASKVVRSLRRAYVESVEYAFEQNTAEKMHEGLRTLYSRILRENDEVLGPYFRVVYHLFNLVHQSKLPGAEIERYASIARATFGRDELFMLMLNASLHEHSALRQLIERYGLLKHLACDEDNDIDKVIADRYFAPTAQMSVAERAAHASAEVG